MEHEQLMGKEEEIKRPYDGDGEVLGKKLMEFYQNFLKVKEPRSNLGLTKIIATEAIKEKEVKDKSEKQEL